VISKKILSYWTLPRTALGQIDIEIQHLLRASERVLMNACVTKHRSSGQVAKERNMFLAVVWMTATKRSLFRKFPHVAKLDVAFKTNSRGIPFLTSHHFNGTASRWRGVGDTTTTTTTTTTKKR
jgi:hypothetical protein